MRIAVIGAGISGLTATYLLQRKHDVELLEAAAYPGGHTRTVDVELDGKTFAVDTGFVVYNETTYPGFVKLLKLLEIASRPTDMSFSVSCATSGMEYAGSSLGALFAQRRNLVSLAFYRMLLDIAVFNRHARRSARGVGYEGPLRAYLQRFDRAENFRRRYLVPLISAIWSIDPERVGDFPASFFLRFADRHRLLQVNDLLRWRVVEGGSRQYVRALVSRLRNGVRTGTAVRRVRRHRDGVDVELHDGTAERYDHVVLATHSDQALRLLDDPSEEEREILGAIGYQENDTVLHTDLALMPRRRRAWASWNYRIPREPQGRPITTYDMTALQGLDSPTPILVTLNDNARVDPAKVIERGRFAHPVYTLDAVQAQRRRHLISGVRRTHYCGAYWGYGFHEDGVASAVDVGRDFGEDL